MSSSLAAQLAGIRANNNATILDKSKRKKIHSVSLVHEPKEAATQDFESIYYACMENFRDLEQVDKRFSAFSRTLFSETSIRFDRLVQQGDQVDALNRTINQFLMLISKYLNLQPAIGSLEWLIRRFHANIHNSENLLLCALPWFSEGVFIRILEVVPMQNIPPLFKFLQASKTTLQCPSKNTLVRVLHKDVSLYRLVNAYILDCVSSGLFYDRELVFWTNMNVMVAMVYKESNDQAILDLLLPYVSQMLPRSDCPDCQVAAYTALIVLCTQFQLAEDIIEACIATICGTWSKLTSKPGLAAITQLVGNSETTDSPFSPAVWQNLHDIPHYSTDVLKLTEHHDIEPFVIKWATSIFAYAPQDIGQLVAVLPNMSFHGEPYLFTLSTLALDFLLTGAKAGTLTSSVKSLLVPYFEWLLLKHSRQLESALEAKGLSFEYVELSLESSLIKPETPALEQNGHAAKANDETQIDAFTRADVVAAAEGIKPLKSLSVFTLQSPDFDPRAKLWIMGTANVNIDKPELLKLAKVNEDAEVSFLAAISIGPYPQLSRAEALDGLLNRVEKTRKEDYQALLPLILSLLMDPSRKIRELSASIIRALDEGAVTKPSSAWGHDTIYGAKTSSQLIWLSNSEEKPVLKAITSQLQECILDDTHVVTIASKAGKSSWLQFLASHACVTTVPQVLLLTLKALKGHKGVVKLVSPLLSSWLSSRPEWKQRAERYRLSITQLDEALVGVIQSNDRSGIDFLKSALKGPLSLAESAGAQVISIWNGGVLTVENKNILFSALIDVSMDESAPYDPATVLDALRLETNNFLEILEQCKLQRQNIFNPAANGNMAKRRRRRSSSTVQLKDASNEVITFAEQHLQKLTLVLELVDQNVKTISDPCKLFASLFNILDELISLGTDSNLPVLYTEELLANCLTNLVEKAKTLPDQNFSSIRVDVIVSCIRTTTSPQVQNRLLLLIASLATVVPDLVFHSVMPIFTFMGANTVRLDNDFSAHVIQQTISQVIPALVACGDKQAEIDIALRSFVAAFPHIPRHRRLKLFGALVKTLGPSASLYKLLLLLGQKYADLQAKKKSSDAKSLVHFTTAFGRSFTIYEQLFAVEKYVIYVHDLKTNDEEANSGEVPLLKLQGSSLSINQMKTFLYQFLSETFGSDQVISGMQPLRLQIASHEDFTPENLGCCAKLIDILLSASDDSDVEVKSASFELLSKTLELLPIDKFAKVISELISNETDIAVKKHVLELINKKFEYELKDDPAASSSALETLNILTTSLVLPESQLKPEIIDDIDILVVKYGSSMDAETQTNLLDILVGQFGILSSDIYIVVSAINCINSLTQNLGARMIGHFGRILPVLFAKCEQAANSPTTQETDMLQWATFGLLSGLVQRIPSFMGSPAKRIFELAFTSTIDLEPRNEILQLIGEKMDTQHVLGLYISTWESAVHGGLLSIKMFLNNLEKVLDQASKKDVAAKSSQLIGLVLKCFTIRDKQHFNANEVNRIESQVVSMALEVVLKLNDKVFRPLFVRMSRWAFEDDGASMPAPFRQVVMFKFIVRLCGRLKSIVTNYYGYVLTPACNILEGEETNHGLDDTLRKLVYESLILSFSSDQDDFWQSPARFDHILSVLLQQLDRSPVLDGKLLVRAIVSLSEATASQEYRKKINDGLAERLVPKALPATKIWTVRVLSNIYTKLGDEWISMLPQLVPLIAELLEDDDEAVEREVRKELVPVIEGVLGESLDRYLS